MRTSISLNDISNIVCDVVSSGHPAALGILSSLPTVQGGTRLAIFYSSATVFNAQISASRQQIHLLQAENATLKDTIKALNSNNDSLVAELEVLRDQKAKLEDEKQNLVDELRVEKFQGSVRVKKAREDKNRIMKLLEIAKQRDAFIYAMIDIDLHQPVLLDAYATVKDGRPADHAISEAIQSAASKPGSPWSRILAPLDVTKSDLYKCAIELAATARLRTDEKVRIARFWKHVATYDNQNIGAVTPSPSTLDVIDAELQKEERGTVLDDLLERLRAGEDIRLKEKKKKLTFVMPGTPVRTPTSPTSAFFKRYRETVRSNGSCFSSSSVSPSNLDLRFREPLDLTTLVPNQDSDFFSPNGFDHTPRSAGPASSLERICRVFMVSDNEETLEDRESSSENSFGHLNIAPCPLQSGPPSAAGRGRSATFPFSKRDFVLPPVKDVFSKAVVVTSPGDKEREAQEILGQRVRFDSGSSLARSKAVLARRPQTPRSGIPMSPMRRATPKLSTPVGKHVPSPPRSPLPTRNRVTNLPTPPSEGDSITYVRPPTVTRKRGTGPPSLAKRFAPKLPISPARIPSSPLEQKIRPYIVGGSSLALNSKLESGVSSSSGSNSGSLAPAVKSPARGAIRMPRPSVLSRRSEPDKENVPPQRSGISRFNVSRSTSLASASTVGPPRGNRKPRQRPSPVVKPVIPILKPIQPLKIVKKKPTQIPIALATMPEPVSARSPTSPPQQRITHLPRAKNSPE